MSRWFRAALILQAVAVAVPTMVTSYTTVGSMLKPPASSINMWPAFWVLTLIIFFAPFIVIVDWNLVLVFEPTE